MNRTCFSKNLSSLIHISHNIKTYQGKKYHVTGNDTTDILQYLTLRIFGYFSILDEKE